MTDDLKKKSMSDSARAPQRRKVMSPEAKLAEYAERIHLHSEDVDYLLSLLQEARALGSQAGAEAEREECACFAEFTGPKLSFLPRSQESQERIQLMREYGRRVAAKIRARKE